MSVCINHVTRVVYKVVLGVESLEKPSIEIQAPDPTHNPPSRYVPPPLSSRTHSHRSQRSNHTHHHAEPGESVSLNNMRRNTADPSPSLEHERAPVQTPRSSRPPPSPNNMYTDPKLHPLAPKLPPPVHNQNHWHRSKKDQKRREQPRSKSNSDATSATAAGTVESNMGTRGNRDGDLEGAQPAMRGRRPPFQPILKEENRYCYRCCHVKPMRAHHCRACGTVSVNDPIRDTTDNANVSHSVC